MEERFCTERICWERIGGEVSVGRGAVDSVAREYLPHSLLLVNPSDGRALRVFRKHTLPFVDMGMQHTLVLHVYLYTGWDAYIICTSLLHTYVHDTNSNDIYIYICYIYLSINMMCVHTRPLTHECIYACIYHAQARRQAQGSGP
jgi:hypothetical protein